MWLVLANAVFNKLWSLAFFDRGAPFIALLLLALVILPTAVLIPVFMALDAAFDEVGKGDGPLEGAHAAHGAADDRIAQS